MRSIKRLMAFVLCLVMVLGMVPGTVMAAGPTTYYVANSHASYPGDDANNGKTTDKPFLTLGHALDVAQTGDTIKLLSDIDLARTLEINNGKSVTIDGSHYNIIAANTYQQTGTKAAIIKVTAGSNIEFKDVTLTRNNGNYTSRILYVQGATATLRDAIVTGGYLNTSDPKASGAAICIAANGIVNLDGTTQIKHNSADNTAASGGIVVGNKGFLNITGAVIENNSGTKGDGIYVDAGGKLVMKSQGNPITINEQVFVAVGATAQVGATNGNSSKINLQEVYLDTAITQDATVATLDIIGDTRQSKINIECSDDYHQVYRLISREDSSVYSIDRDKTGGMDEDGWFDEDGRRDIRYMTYNNVPGLYFYYFTLNAEFNDITTLTGITGLDINSNDGRDFDEYAVSYYKDHGVINESESGGVLTIPDLIAIDGSDFTFKFTVDEANKVYRIPTPDMVDVLLDGTSLTKGTDYIYTPDYENGTATLTVNEEFLKNLTSGGTLRFEISGEKYYKLSLQMNGPLYTMKTDITGLKVESEISVAENMAPDRKSVTYTLTRGGQWLPGIDVILYEEDIKDSEYRGKIINTATSDAEGRVTFENLDPSKYYYYSLSYKETFDVIYRDTMDITLDTTRGQKLTKTSTHHDSSACELFYSVADDENHDKATSQVIKVKNDTTVSFTSNKADNTITFQANPGVFENSTLVKATTWETAKFYFTDGRNPANFEAQTASKVILEEAHTYGDLPTMTMVGYTFEGWYTNPDYQAGTKVESTTAYEGLKSPQVLYARWTRNETTHYEVQHWVELTEKTQGGYSGVNPGYQDGTTQTRTLPDGTTYYLWATDLYEGTNLNNHGGTSDTLLASTVTGGLLERRRTAMTDSDHTWWTMDGLTPKAQSEEAFVQADGSSVFSIYYDRNVYTINYDPTAPGRMMTTVDTQDHKFGEINGELLAATRPGYTFGGWFTMVDTTEHGVDATDWYSWTNDINVFAKWREADTTYLIAVWTENIEKDETTGVGRRTGDYSLFKTIANGNDGERLAGVSDTEREVLTDSILALTVEGFTYIGYSTTGDEHATGLVSATDRFKVTPNEYGARAYDVDGFPGEKATVINLYYSRNEATVDFMKDDTGDDVHKNITVVYGDEFENALNVISPNPTKPGYDFTRWVDSEGNTVNEATRVNDYTKTGSVEMEIRPVWTAREYYMTYVPGTGTTFDVSEVGSDLRNDMPNAQVEGGYVVAKTVTYDETMGAMPTVSKPGYVWDGWFLEEGPSKDAKVTNDTPVTIDTVVIENPPTNEKEETRPLYARYTPFTYTLELDPNGGEVSPTSITLTFDEAVDDLPTPTRTGYTFTGWLLDPAEAGTSRIEKGNIVKIVTTNHATIHATAAWTNNTYRYTIHLNDTNDPDGVGSTTAVLNDSSIRKGDVDYDTTYADVVNNISAHRDGYDFLGWSTERNDMSKIIKADDTNTVAKDMDLYAVWQPRVTYIEFHWNDAEEHWNNEASLVNPEQGYRWQVYANTHYEQYNNKYNPTTRLEAKELEHGVWSVPVIFDTTYGDLDELQRDHYKFEGYTVSAPGWYKDEQPVMDGKLTNTFNIPFTNVSGMKMVFNATWTPIFDFDLRLTDSVLPNIDPDATFSDGTKGLKDKNGNDTGIKALLRTDIDALDTPVRKGYAFLGWQDTVTQKFVTLTDVKGTSEYRVLEAYFTPLITFDPNGGEVIVGNEKYSEPYTVALSELTKYGDFYSARKEGQTFGGWKSEQGDMTTFNNLKNSAIPVTLVAVYDTTVTFNVPQGASWADDVNESTRAGSTSDCVVTTRDLDQWIATQRYPDSHNLPTLKNGVLEFLGWYLVSDPVAGTTPVSASYLSDLTESKTVYAVFSIPDQLNINVKVTNYAVHNGSNIATVQAPSNGWIPGDNTFIVTSAQPCGVALVRGGVMTELIQNNANGDMHSFTESLQDGDEIIIVLKGDTDLDGEVTTGDATCIARSLIGAYDLNNAATLAADGDCDGEITTGDATCVARNLISAYNFFWNHVTMGN